MTESEITRFLKKAFREEIEPKLKQLGYIPPSEEKYLLGKRFDVYAYSRKKRRFAIFELEIKSGHYEHNVSKLDDILNFRWRPKVFMFHIFSPYYYEKEKKKCKELAKKLKKNYPRKFVYEQFDIDISFERFERMLNAFESNKYSAKQYYGKELKKEIRGVISKSIVKL